MREVTWNELEILTRSLAEQVKSFIKGYEQVFIYGEPRGGLIPAVLLSHELQLPLITDLKKLSVREKTLLLYIDDLIETGETAHRAVTDIQFRYPHVKTTPLFLFHKQPLEPKHIYAEKANLNEWILFPWENKKRWRKDYEEYQASRNK